jgi:tyrosyl-tRNA synthetase
VYILLECKVIASKGEARRAIDAGGIYLNNHRVRDFSTRIASADVIDNQFIVLRRGRKNYWLIRITP